VAGLEDNLVRIRRFLRDHDGIVWSDADILQSWNDAQLELCQKTKFLERIESHYYPPEYNWSYLFQWENLQTYPFIEGDVYRALTEYHQTEYVFCYPWEGMYWGDLSDAPDDGYRFSHPWEGVLCGSPADVISLKMHTRFQRMKFIAFDEDPIDEIQLRDVAADDPHWKTRSGTVTNYYMLDETLNLYCLYPRPSEVTYQETTEGDVFSDTGGLTFDFGSLLESDTGMVTDVIDTEDAVFMVYDAIPFEMAEWDDECDVPDVFRKYVEYGTLERCFGADSDGFIPTLRDYWKMRKDAGIEAIKRMMRMRAKDRDYQFGGVNKPYRGRGGSLGPHYPSI
jgi:hypothetical protein